MGKVKPIACCQLFVWVYQNMLWKEEGYNGSINVMLLQSGLRREGYNTYQCQAYSRWGLLWHWQCRFGNVYAMHLSVISGRGIQYIYQHNVKLESNNTYIDVQPKAINLARMDTKCSCIMHLSVWSPSREGCLVHHMPTYIYLGMCGGGGC